MHPKEIAKDVPSPLAEIPKHLVDDVRAGLADLKHSRGVSGEVVLANIDKKLSDWHSRNSNK